MWYVQYLEYLEDLLVLVPNLYLETVVVGLFFFFLWLVGLFLAKTNVRGRNSKQPTTEIQYVLAAIVHRPQYQMWITPKIRMLYFVLINSVIQNHLRVWISAVSVSPIAQLIDFKLASYWRLSPLSDIRDRVLNPSATCPLSDHYFTCSVSSYSLSYIPYQANAFKQTCVVVFWVVFFFTFPGVFIADTVLHFG